MRATPTVQLGAVVGERALSPSSRATRADVRRPIPRPALALGAAGTLQPARANRFPQPPIHPRSGHENAVGRGHRSTFAPRYRKMCSASAQVRMVARDAGLPPRRAQAAARKLARRPPRPSTSEHGAEPDAWGRRDARSAAGGGNKMLAAEGQAGARAAVHAARRRRGVTARLGAELLNPPYRSPRCNYFTFGLTTRPANRIAWVG